MLPKTIANGYSTGRKLKGEVRQCAICGGVIYVRLYRLRDGFFCGHCRSKYAGNSKTGFAYQILSRLKSTDYEIRVLLTTRDEIVAKIKKAEDMLQVHQRVLEYENSLVK